MRETKSIGERAWYRDLASGLEAVGFDLVQPGRVGWYNDAVDPAYALPDFGSPESLVLVVGNTRALWPAFVQAYRSDPGLAGERHPLDRYTERSVGRLLPGLAMDAEVRFSHEPPPRRVAMQRLAHVSGLAHLSPSYLSVHPVFGPWIALRAAIVLPVSGPPGPAPAWQAPCVCAHHCAAPFERACQLAAQEPSLDHRAIAHRWRAWVAVRDACPVGREHRYGEAQIAYHYTKDRDAITA